MNLDYINLHIIVFVLKYFRYRICIDYRCIIYYGGAEKYN